MILILNRGKNCSFGDLQENIKKECKNEVLIFALFTKLYSFFYFQLSNELYKKAGYFPTLPKHF